MYRLLLRKLDPSKVSASENSAELGVMPSAASVVHLQGETGKSESGACCSNGPCLNPVFFALEATSQGKRISILTKLQVVKQIVGDLQSS